MVVKSSKRELFHSQYLKELASALATVSQKEIDAAIERIIKAVTSEKRIWVIGNGGSAATASHFAADLMRPINQEKYRVRATTLSESITRITAIGNDYGFEKIFDNQINTLAQPGDLLVAISASGNSLNVLNGVRRAKSMKIEILSMVGFSGGSLKNRSTQCLHFQTKEGAYEISEDCHSLICHYIAKSVRTELEKLYLVDDRN